MLGRFLAKRIPGARYIELPGIDHVPAVGDNAMEIADAIGEFLTGAGRRRSRPTPCSPPFSSPTSSARPRRPPNSATDDGAIFLTIITLMIRRNLAHFRGHEVKTTGDGVVATFDGPARGVRCACAIADETKPLGSTKPRAGLHTGEAAKSWATTTAALPFTLALASRRSLEGR